MFTVGVSFNFGQGIAHISPEVLKMVDSVRKIYYEWTRQQMQQTNKMNNTGNKLSDGTEVYTCFPYESEDSDNAGFPFINKPGALRRMIKQCTVGVPFFGNFLGLRREDQQVSLSCLSLGYAGNQSRKIANHEANRQVF